jgi:hypothetical protein
MQFNLNTASLSKYHFSAGVELMSIVPNFVMSNNSMMQMCSCQLSDLNLTLCLIAKKVETIVKKKPPRSGL